MLGTWIDGGGEEAGCFLVATVDGARLRALGYQKIFPGLSIGADLLPDARRRSSD